MTCEAVGLFFAEKMMAGPAEDEFATESCELLRRPIPAREPELFGFFHIDHDGEVFDHRVEKLFGTFRFGFSLMPVRCLYGERDGVRH